MNRVKEYFLSDKFIKHVLILVFLLVIIIVTKTMFFRYKSNKYEEHYKDIVEKQSTEMKVIKGSTIDSNLIKDSKASKVVDCINNSLTNDELSNELNNIIKEINNYYNSSNNYFAFAYKDLYTGFTVTYNASQPIFGASTIKAPKDIYIYEEASIGNINLDEKLIYNSSYYNTGTGILKNGPFDKEYTVRELSSYSTMYSDNAAHNMLMNRFGRKSMQKFWEAKGTKEIFKYDTNWGNITGEDAIIYMSELYNFYLNNSKYGKEVMDNFLKAQPKFIKGKNDSLVANKSGWSGSSIHDVSIVFDDNPYIVVALSNLGYTASYQDYFNKVNELAYKLHKEYWNYKINKCQNIIK